MKQIGDDKILAFALAFLMAAFFCILEYSRSHPPKHPAPREIVKNTP